MIRLNIEADTVKDFEALLASLRFGAPALVEGAALKPIAEMPHLVATMVEVPKIKTPKAKAAEPAPAPVVEAKPEPVVAAPEPEKVEAPAAEVEEVPAPVSDVPADVPAGDTVDFEALGKEVRAVLVKVREAHGTTRMLDLIGEAHPGAAVVRDVPGEKLADLLKAAHAVLAAPAAA